MSINRNQRSNLLKSLSNSSCQLNIDKQNNFNVKYYKKQKIQKSIPSINDQLLFNNTTLESIQYSPNTILPIMNTTYFYHDNNIHNQYNGIRLAIQSNYNRSLETLLEELTENLAYTSSNEQIMFTSNSIINKVKSMNDLQQNNYNIDINNQLKSCNILMNDKITNNKINKKYNQKSIISPISLNSNAKTTLYKSENCLTLPIIDTVIIDTNENIKWKQMKQVKRIYVRLNGQSYNMKPVLIKRKYIKNFENVLQELSDIFKIPIHKVYTIDGELIETLRDLLDGPNEFIAAGFERFRPLNEMHVSTRCLSRSSSRARNQTKSPTSSILPSLKQHCEQFNKGYSSNDEFTVCQIFIKSGQNDPQTNESYITACTANPTITICNKYQSTQPILLRSAYICTLNLNDENVQGIQDNELNETNTINSIQKGPFYPGSVDYFEIPTNGFMEISKIRISHDGFGDYPEWLPEEIYIRLSQNPPSMTMNSLKFNENSSVSLNRLLNSDEESNLLSGTTFTYELSFPCMRWLSRFKGDGSLIREIAAPGTQLIDQTPRFGRILRAYPLDVTTLLQQEERAPVIQYQVITKTGNLWNSGMNNTTKVNILIQGDRGDTGTRTLWNKEITKINAFSRGKTSVFYVEAVFLGRLKSLTLWLEPDDNENNKSISTNWYLEYVIIQQLSVNCYTYNHTKISNTLSSTSTSSLPVTNNSNKISNDISAIYIFPCFQWLTTGFGMNSLPIKLIPVNGSGVLTTDLMESIMANQKEQIFWQAEKWKFKPGTKIVFYSYLTGAPMRMIDSNRIDCQPIDSVIGVSNQNTKEVFNVSYALTGSRRSKTVKPPSYQQFNTKNILDRHKKYNVYQNEDYSNTSSNGMLCNTIINNNNKSTKCIRSFSSVQNPWLYLCLDDISGLHLKITSNLESQCYDFKIRPQSNRFIALEINKGNSLQSRKLHVYVGPNGRIVSAATGPITIPGKLFLPYVKGCLRDHTILWLCTEIQQTLIPVLIHQTNENNSEVKINSCKFDLRATGERNTEAYWRVHKVDKNVRRFESVAWPGHFLRVTSDCVDAMGGGGMDCYFQIIRIRCKGFLQLSPLVNIKKIIGMNEDGTITLYDKYTMEEYSRFYPEVIKYGVSSPQIQELDSSCLKDRLNDLSSQLITSNSVISNLLLDDKTNEIEKTQRTERKISSSIQQQQQLFELVQCHDQTDVKDVDSTKSTFGDDTDSNDNGSNQPQALDSPNENQDLKDSNWKLSIYTEKLAQNCEVILVVYGTDGNSGPILIGRSNDVKGLFQANRIDNFMIILENVGMIYKIRLEVNQINPDVQSEWEVDKVILENVEVSKPLIFDFSGRPFGKYKNFCCLSREQVISVNLLNNTSITMKHQLNNELQLFLLNYRIQIEFSYNVTNSKDISNISIEPYICLIGQYGDCGRRLIGSITGKQLISVEKRNVLILDTLIEAAYLGEVTSCFLGPVDVEDKPQEERTGLLCTDILIWDTKKEVIYEFPSETWLLLKSNGQTHEIHLKVGRFNEDNNKPEHKLEIEDNLTMKINVSELGNKNESQDVHHNTEDELDILRDGTLA
ncbi:hypothetical protein MN116_000729 [Schistosoma mekongi]|uniref:Lipoxygenase homology domain-containing protein n=1 Tax=Schistosoma mekongi TaxID=38744 RepID=A0AAE2D954_SCHME|nr:hypothetical protein MN116_000729 [Schistosoma mekongi]